MPDVMIKRVIVSQLGAREHYAIPARFANRGMLQSLVTEAWVSSKYRRILEGNNLWFLKALEGRHRGDLDSLVQQIPHIFFTDMLLRNNPWSLKYDHYCRIGSLFAKATKASLLADHDIFFGFTGGSLEALEYEKQHGRQTILDQIDPARVEYETVMEERRKYSGWEDDNEGDMDRYFSRIEAEWELSDLIVVNSRWSRDALITQGVPEQKIRIIPVSYSNTSIIKYPADCRPERKKLKILWLGTLCLRKGFPYALEAARMLEHAPVEFNFYGSSQINLDKIKWPGNSKYMGKVARVDIGAVYRDHDLFLLPTLSDGFAITQVEAMANGLPVIATRCCGDVVCHNKSGFIIDERSPSAIVAAIEAILSRENELGEMKRAAIDRSQEFSDSVVSETFFRELF